MEFYLKNQPNGMPFGEYTLIVEMTGIIFYFWTLVLGTIIAFIIRKMHKKYPRTAMVFATLILAKCPIIGTILFSSFVMLFVIKNLYKTKDTIINALKEKSAEWY